MIHGLLITLHNQGISQTAEAVDLPTSPNIGFGTGWQWQSFAFLHVPRGGGSKVQCPELTQRREIFQPQRDKDEENQSRAFIMNSK